MPIVASPDTVSQPAPHAALTVEFSHGTRWNVLRDGALIGFIGERYDHNDEPCFWAEPVARYYPTIDTATTAIERAWVRAQAESEAAA